MNFSKKIYILDGAMGTMLQSMGLSAEVNDIFNITNPDAICEIHKSYIEAGCDIIETNTFNANSISLNKYGLDSKVYEINLKGAQLAKKVSDESCRKVYVAGSIGPSSIMLSLSNNAGNPERKECSFDNLAEAYYYQALGLIDGGIDFFLVETIFDSLNAKAALYAIEKAKNERGVNTKTMISATVSDRFGRLLSGMEIEAFYNTVKGYDLLSFGLNCSFGAKEMIPIVESLAPRVSCPFSIYPNAGLPNELGVYDCTDKEFADYIAMMAQKGLINIAGGCCGTTPAHIKALSNALKGIKPREIPCIEPTLTVTSLSTIEINLSKSNFINVGERTNVAGSRRFARVIAEHNYEEALEIAKKQINDGASIIDINMDDAMLDSASEMGRFVRYLENDPETAKAALMIDSSNWDTILEGLKNSIGKCIVNSISLKDGEDEFIRKAKEIKSLGAAVIVMAFDEVGQATTYDRKIEICQRAYGLLTEKVNFKPEDIIFDTNILTIATGVSDSADYGIDFIKSVKWIKDNLKGCRTSGGVSNLSFAFRGNNSVREAIHSVFLYHAINAGLDMAIVNPSMLQIYDNIDGALCKAIEDVIFNADDKATDRLVSMAQQLSDSKQIIDKSIDQPSCTDWRMALDYAILHGKSDGLSVCLNEAVKELNGIEIIEGPLMESMSNIGKAFSEGKMFLPQVIKSAQTMRDAVSILNPHISSTSNIKVRKKIVLATAKGDVHDIGKNILNIILTCNGLDVIDLGVMVDNRDIIEAAVVNNADFIGLGGLISPSLKYMEELCEMMEEKKMNTPLFVGGATASLLHTSVKLSPLYSGDVFYTGNASECADTINQYISDPVTSRRENFLKQKKIREIYLNRNKSHISIEEARAKAPTYPEVDFEQPSFFGQEDYLNKDIDLYKVSERIDWQMFLSFWGFKAPLINSGNNPEISAVINDGKLTLEKICRDKSIKVSALVKYFDAVKDMDSILVGTERFEVSRNTSNSSKFESLSDYFLRDKPLKIGLFAIKVEDMDKDCICCKDYEHLIRDALCQRIAEATSSILFEKETKGYNAIRPAFGYASCPDHSLKKNAFRLLDAENVLGLKLTESFGIVPSTSICGMYIMHKDAHYL